MVSPNFHRICKILYAKQRGKQHTGVLRIYLSLTSPRTTPDSPRLDIASMTTFKALGRYFIQVSYRRETQYIDVIFRQVMKNMLASSSSHYTELMKHAIQQKPCC